MNKHPAISGASRIEDVPGLIDALCEIYDKSVANLRAALARYLKNGERPDPQARAEGLFAYPELGSTIAPARRRLPRRALSAG